MCKICLCIFASTYYMGQVIVEIESYTCWPKIVFWPTRILFTFTGSVRNDRNDVNIYIYIYILYICQQHGGREVGTKFFGYISVKFIRLLLILSAKGLLDQKSSSKYYFSR